MTVSPPPTDTDRPEACCGLSVPHHHPKPATGPEIPYVAPPGLVRFDSPADAVFRTPENPRKAALHAVRNMAADWYCPFDEQRQRIDCPECVAQVALDAYEALFRLDHGITS